MLPLPQQNGCKTQPHGSPQSPPGIASCLSSEKRQTQAATLGPMPGSVHSASDASAVQESRWTGGRWGRPAAGSSCHAQGPGAACTLIHGIHHACHAATHAPSYGTPRRLCSQAAPPSGRASSCATLPVMYLALHRGWQTPHRLFVPCRDCLCHAECARCTYQQTAAATCRRQGPGPLKCPT